jgi:multiple sugar transport system ATP-binding protein
MAEVIIRELTKSFDDNTVVKSVSLKVENGEFLVLLGPSGCGKSTILRLIAGLEDVTSGEILIDGKIVNFVNPADRNAAFVFQNYALYPHMTVKKNIAFPLETAGMSKSEIEKSIEDVARILELQTLLERLPSQLSGGQRQRVALARAIVRKPVLFLMDEPLSNLDAQLRQQTRIELMDLHQRLGITTIYVTHDQVEAMTMGKRIAILKDGVLQQVDTPSETYEKPANTFVARFMGAPPMNLVSGSLVLSGDQSNFSGNGINVKLDISSMGLSSAVIKTCSNDELLLGIRPEHLKITSQGSHAIEGIVKFLEPTGADLFVTVLVGTESIVVRCEPKIQLVVGSTVYLGFDLGNSHLFASDGWNLRTKL